MELSQVWTSFWLSEDQAGKGMGLQLRNRLRQAISARRLWSDLESGWECVRFTKESWDSIFDDHHITKSYSESSTQNKIVLFLRQKGHLWLDGTAAIERELKGVYFQVLTIRGVNIKEKLSNFYCIRYWEAITNIVLLI